MSGRIDASPRGGVTGRIARRAPGFAILLAAVLLVPSAGWIAASAPPAAGSPSASPGSAILSHFVSSAGTHLRTGERPTSTGVLSPSATLQFGHGPAPHRVSQAAPHPFAYRPSARSTVGGFAAPVSVISVKPTGTVGGQATLGVGFQGENAVQCSCAPPDVIAAASPTQVVEMVNSEIAIWSTGGTKLGNESDYTFFSFSSSTSFLSDPRITYDAEAGRWYASILEASSSAALVPFAVSSTGDALGNWTIYLSIAPPSGDLGDQPILGYSHDLLSLATNDFGGGGLAGSQYWVINKSAVLNGSAASFASFGPDANSFSIHPVHADQPRDGMYLVQTFGGNPGAVELYSVTGVPPATTTVVRTNLTVGNVANPPPARQPGTSDTLDSSNPHTGDALWSGGHVWLTYTVTCLVAGANHSCIRITEIGVAGSPTVLQDFDIAVNATDLFYGAISIDAFGSLVVGFGFSSGTAYPSLAVTYRTAIDPVDSVHTGTLVRSGSASNTCGGTGCRYGDYFGAWAQPGSGAVWVAGEYITTAQAATGWQSWLESVRAPPPMAVVNSVMPLRADVGEPVTVWVNVTNSGCPPTGIAQCSVSVPFGDGYVATVNCLTLGASTSFMHSFATPGTYNVSNGGSVVVYADGSCAPGNASQSFALPPVAVTVIASAVVTTGVSPSTGSDAGEPITLHVAVSGGAPPYTFSWSGLPTGCTSQNLSSLPCVPSLSGDFNVLAQVNDSIGGVVNGSLFVHVDPAPSARLFVVPAFGEVGQPVQLLGSASNGSGEYSYVWTGTPPGCAPVNVSSTTCTPTQSGTYTLLLAVTDSRGISVASPNVVLQVAPALTVVLTASSTSVSPGDAVALYATTMGGVGPFTYAWSGLPSGCTAETGPNVTCSPSSGSFAVTVTAQDSLGAKSSSTVHLTASQSAVSFLGVPLTWVIGLVIVLVAVALVVVFLTRRTVAPRGPARPPRSPPTTP